MHYIVGVAIELLFFVEVLNSKFKMLMLLSCTDPEIFSGGWGLTDNLSFVGEKEGGWWYEAYFIHLCEYNALIFGGPRGDPDPPPLDLSIVVVYI